MPNLGDYLGQLLSEVTMARVQADLEAVRVGELYATHPLLRHMAVPHFRLPEVELDVPVVVQASEEPRPGESTRGGLDPERFKASFVALVGRRLKEDGIRITADQQRRLEATVAQAWTSTATQPEVGAGVFGSIDALSASVDSWLAESQPAGLEAPERRVSFQRVLKARARAELPALETAPPRLQVLVTSQELREAAPTSIARFHLKVSESAVEWRTIETDAGDEDRLVPE